MSRGDNKIAPYFQEPWPGDRSFDVGIKACEFVPLYIFSFLYIIWKFIIFFFENFFLFIANIIAQHEPPNVIKSKRSKWRKINLNESIKIERSKEKKHEVN